MTSRDFGFLALRNTTAYQPNGLPVPPNRVLITSTNGAGVFSNTLSISSISTNTISTSVLSGNVSVGTSLTVPSFSTNTISSATISNLVPYIGATKDLNMGLSSIVSKNIYLTDNNNGFVNLTIENNIYGNLDMNGYFIQYATGASQSSNPIVSLPSDIGQPTYFINSGNFGIGTSTPDYTLDVNGNIRVSDNGLGTILTGVNTSDQACIESNFLNITNFGATNYTMSFDNTNKRVGINNQTPDTALDINGDLTVNGTSISRVSTTSIPSNPGSGGWTSYYGKYCFIDGDSVGTLTLPTAGDVPSDGTILVIRNIGTSGTITINNSIGGASILAGKTISYVYTTTVAAGWYSLYN